ncbi:MAG: hypothetical protein SFV22_17430 [Saprospiraceae bacterium]|nr:hypothetical protein [Saprospiraceae bacterium]
MAKPVRIVFHVFLMLTLFGMVVGILYFLLMRRDFLADSPGVEPYFDTYVGAAMVTAAGAIALLRDKKWGFWLMLGGFTTAGVVEILAEIPWGKIVRIPVAMLVTGWLARQNHIL